jgi:hypothetical protein
MEEISHNGSLCTKTDFKLDTGARVRVEVWFTTEATSANRATYYNCNIFTKGKGCRNWIFRFRSKNSLDERIFEFITEEQLYTAYHNHWVKLNPIRHFSSGSFNGKLMYFRVKEKTQQTDHYSF